MSNLSNIEERNFIEEVNHFKEMSYHQKVIVNEEAWENSEISKQVLQIMGVVTNIQDKDNLGVVETNI